MKIIDAHSHIDYITHTIQPDVCGTVCCTTNEEQWQQLQNMIQADDKIYGCFGVHPWFVDSVKDDFDKRLEYLLKNNSKYMVGEIGLDKHKPNMDTQMVVFEKQFNVAIKMKRPVFIHCVGAWDKMLCVLKNYKQSQMPKIIVHAFNDSDDILKKLLSYKNIVFSFGKNTLYDRNHRIEQIELDRILVETDGKKDVCLKDVVARIARIKGDIDVSHSIYNNTLGILQNGQIS